MLQQPCTEGEEKTEAAADPGARAYVDWLFSADAVRAAALTGTHSFQKVLFCLDDSFASPPADKCSTPGLQHTRLGHILTDCVRDEALPTRQS